MTRVFVHLPGGGRLTVTNVTRPGQGTVTARILDEETGWWVQQVVDFGIVAETLEGFFAKVSKVPAPQPFTSRIDTRSGFDLTVSVGSDPNELGTIVRSLEEAGRLSDLGQSIPESVRQRILIFHDLGRSHYQDAEPWKVFTMEGTPLAAILADALAAAGFEGGAPRQWTVSYPRSQRWDRVTDPEILDFVAGFDSAGSDGSPLPPAEVDRLLYGREER